MFDFLKRKQKQAPLGTITVQGKTIKNITPLGNKHSPGVTKAGRLSFTGFLDGKKVKMYSAFSQRQVELNHAIRDVQFGGLNFPEIVASEKNLIVEEWISGKSLKELDEKSINEAAEVVSLFLTSCKDARVFKELAENYHDAFCYIEDYLLERIGTWLHLDTTQRFVESWEKDYLKNKGKLSTRLTHPDLSLANIIKEKGTDKFFIIDNELLGVGPGWILDWHNSFLSRKKIIPSPHEEEIGSEFIEKTWRLRLLGSAFEAGKFHRATKLLNSSYT